jgi:hypothetical protein
MRERIRGEDIREKIRDAETHILQKKQLLHEINIRGRYIIGVTHHTL